MDQRLLFYLHKPMYFCKKKKFGEMPEWFNGAVSKTVVCLTADPGFESLSLRKLENAATEWHFFIGGNRKLVFGFPLRKKYGMLYRHFLA